MGRMADRIRAVTRRGTEAAFSLVLALLCFVAILAILGLSFPAGMSLQEIIRTGDGAATGGPLDRRDADLGDAVLSEVAVLSAKTRKVKDKAVGAIAWGDARIGMGLAGGHAIQTFEHSGATISFGEGSELRLAENSLVVLKSYAGRVDGSEREISLVIHGGEVRGSIERNAADKVRVRVTTASGAAKVRTRRESEGPVRFRVSVDEKSEAAQISVDDGTAEVSAGSESIVLEANQAVEIRPDAPLGLPEVSLGSPLPLEPGRRALRTYRTLPPRVTFRWQPVAKADDYLFVLARDSGFRDRVFEEVRRGTSFDFGTLPAGEYHWRVSARRDGVVGGPGPARRLRVLQDQEPPTLRVEWPEETVAVATAVVRGRTEPGARVFVANEEATVDAQGRFAREVPLVRGTNVVVVEAVDAAGNTAYESRMIESDPSRTE